MAISALSRNTVLRQVAGVAVVRGCSAMWLSEER